MSFTQSYELIIKKVEEKDIDAGIEMVKEFYLKAFKEQNLAFKYKDVKKLCEIIARKNISFIAYDGKKAVGSIGGFIIPHVFDSDEKMFNEVFWYVREEYRKSSLGIRLMKAIEEYCKNNKIKYCLMASLGNRRDDALCKLYSKRGYKHFETVYIKTIGE